MRPSKYDIVILTNTELVTVFNTGNAWYKISCNSFDYLDNLFFTVDLKADNPITMETFKGILYNVDKNSEQSFDIHELTIIGFDDPEGSKIYLYNKSGDLRKIIFRRLTNQESKYYQHNGILF